MDDNRPKRRRNLSPAEERSLEKQRKKQREMDRKKSRADAKYREEIRRQRIKNGEDPHIVIEIPARPENVPPKPKKTRKKTTPDIIKAETNKRVRNMNPKDYDDGYYIDEVKVRKDQAKKQRQKRQEKQPKQLTPKQRKFRRNLTYVMICSVIVVIGVVLSMTVLFKTETIEVKGNTVYDNNTIIELAEVSTGHNIFVATLFGNTDAVRDKLPYVKEAKISFKIPNKLIINVVHEEVYSAIKSQGKYYLLNKEGRILDKVDKAPKGIMMVKAGALKNLVVGDYISYQNEKMTSAVKEITSCLSTNNYSGVTVIDVEKMAQISITYDDRILIKIGLPEDIDYKVRTAFTIITKKLDPEGTGKIKGVLNVSECNETKKSYFNEGSLDEEPTAPTIVTQETTETETVISTYVVATEDEENQEEIYDDSEFATDSVE